MTEGATPDIGDASLEQPARQCQRSFASWQAANHQVYKPAFPPFWLLNLYTINPSVLSAQVSLCILHCLSVPSPLFAGGGSTSSQYKKRPAAIPIPSKSPKISQGEPIGDKLRWQGFALSALVSTVSSLSTSCVCLQSNPPPEPRQPPTFQQSCFHSSTVHSAYNGNTYENVWFGTRYTQF